MSSHSSTPERFWTKVDFTGPVPEHRPELGPCWLWQAQTRKGYGQFWDGDRMMPAHRYAYEFCVGPIPEGLTIDHLCRNRPCVLPNHLEPVTNRVNVLRGVGPTAMRARQTHCDWGHAFTGENTYLRPSGGRRCRSCQRQYQLAYLRRQSARAAVRLDGLAEVMER